MEAMSEAPETCAECPITVPAYCGASENTDPYRGEYDPGPACPFVRLDESRAEIERLRAGLRDSVIYRVTGGEYTDEYACEQCGATWRGEERHKQHCPAALNEGGA
jgi:hypothetical protein